MASPNEVLQRLARDLAAPAAANAQNALVWTGRPTAGGEVEVGIKDLGGAHPLTQLTGFVAPGDWWGLGIVATGRARPGERRLVTSVVVNRDGDVAGHVGFADGASIDQPPEGGIVLDALHRCLGLPTPAAERITTDVFLILWLSFVEATARDTRAHLQKMTWIRAARSFPFPDRVTSQDISDAEGFATAVLDVVGGVGWPTLLKWGRNGSLSQLVSADVATWMDEGMFSRWLVSQLPPVHAQLERTCLRLPPAVSSRVRAAVDLLLIGGAARQVA